MLQSTVYRYRTPLLDRPTCHLKISFFTVHFHVASLFTFACKQGQGRGVQLHLSWHPGPRPQAHSDVYVCQPACNDQLTQQRWYRDAPLDVELPRYPTSYHLDPHPSPPHNPASIRLHTSRYRRGDTQGSYEYGFTSWHVYSRRRLHMLVVAGRPRGFFKHQGFWMEVVVPGVLRDFPVM